ncbi:MAG TPA: 3-keto-5-aminohexanoate cleavage protein [Spirochaetales bacterium]|nr:3-keto-5-aminohexanoate cleavage protein [Spirochaetales bacterium]MBP7263012.1 3-keto-5-aminohexanoate cleavage protein [Spirochaetia bacterium]HPE36489.1 3-keto-5-aminohexanoate cleavage protein [Spirochaetales bacterium]
MSLDGKIVITCACTGAETSKELQPALPITPEEVAKTAAECRAAGAAILHLHVRDEQGKATQSVGRFKEAIEAVRKVSDIVIELTTGGAVGDTAEERLRPVTELEPEMASLDCGTVNFGDEYIVNDLPTMRAFASEFKKRRVRATLECFDLGHVYASHYLIKEGLLEPPYHYGFVLNVPGAVPYTVENLSAFMRALPDGADFTVMGIGRSSLPAQYGALANGGWIRVGFEDNVYFSKGVLASSNAQLVERAARIAHEAGLKPATPDDVRKHLKLRG